MKALNDFLISNPKFLKQNFPSQILVLFVKKKENINLTIKKSNQIKTMNRRDVDSNVEEYHPKGHSD